eukprot:COSAG02_NODE_97_length_37159_cov_37.660335_41_plen_805_part_00
MASSEAEEEEGGGAETLEELKARLAAPLLPMLVPVPPPGGAAKRRTTGFLKTNAVAEQALQALSLPEIGRRSLRNSEGEAGSQRAQTERPSPVASVSPEGQPRVAHTERAGLPAVSRSSRGAGPDRVAELRARGFHLLASRLQEEQAATAAAEGQQGELMRTTLEEFHKHMDEFWSREAEAQMVDHLAKRGPRRMAQKLNRRQQSKLAAQKRENEMHQKRVTAAKSVVDVASPPQFEHHKVNRKKLQMQKEQRQELARQNRISRRRVMDSRNGVAGSSSSRAFSMAASPRSPSRHADKPSPRRLAEKPARPRGSQHLSVAATADSRDTRTHRAAIEEVQVPEQEQEREQNSQVEGKDACTLGAETAETKAWIKKMKRACSNGDLSLLNRALEHVDINKSLGGGGPPLSLAAAAGHADIVRVLLKHGADAKGGLISPLELAASSGHVDCVKALMTYSAVQSASAACEKAAVGGHLGALRILLNYNSELLIDLTHSALQQICDATEQRELEVGEVRPKLRVWYKRLRARLGAFDALEAAAESGDVGALRLILKSRPWSPGELDRRFASGWTALSSAAAAGHIEVIQVLLEAGAKPTAQMSDGCDAIVVATQAGMEEAVLLLTLWREKQENASKKQAGSRFKAIAGRGVNKQREKHALINQIRAGGNNSDELPWYQKPGGRPPGSELRDPVRVAAEAVSTHAMRHLSDKNKQTPVPPAVLDFPHGAALGLVSALSERQSYEQELIQKGVNPDSSLAAYGSTDVRAGTSGGAHRDSQLVQQQHRQQDEEDNVPLKVGMRKWRVGDTVV